MLAAGRTVGQVCQSLEVSEQTYQRRQQQYGGMKSGEAKRLKELEVENACLKKLVADLTLDKEILLDPSEGGKRLVARMNSASPRCRQVHVPLRCAGADNMSLELWDNSTDSGTADLQISIHYSVSLNDNPVFGTAAWLEGDREDMILDGGGWGHRVDFRGRPILPVVDAARTETTSAGDVPRIIEFDDMSVRFLDLGYAPGGEEYVVSTVMEARLRLPEFELDIGGRANIGDPNDLSEVGLGRITLIPVPEPSTVRLGLASALILCACLRRAPCFQRRCAHPHSV